MGKNLGAIPQDAVIGDPIPDGANIGGSATPGSAAQSDEQIKAGLNKLNPPDTSSFWGGVGNTVVGAVKGLINPLGIKSTGAGMSAPLQMTGPQHSADVMRQSVSQGIHAGTTQGKVQAGVDALSMANPMAAPVVAGVRELQQQGRYKEAAGVGVGGAAMIAGGEALSRVGAKVMPKAEAVESLNSALNPKTSAAFKRPLTAESTTDLTVQRRNLDSQIDTLARHFEKGSGAAGLTKAALKAANSDPYLSTYIKPNEGLQASTRYIPKYKGENVSPGEATVQQLHERLSTINRMNPQRMRSQEAVELETEANGIRFVLAQTIGKKMGIDPEVVRAARSNYTQLQEIARDTQMGYDDAVRQSNRISNQPLKIGNVAKKVGNIGFKKTGMDSRINKVFSRYQPAEAQTVTPNPPAAKQTRPPGWTGNEPGVRTAPVMKIPGRTGMTETEAANTREGFAFDRRMGRVTGQPQAGTNFSLGQPSPVPGASDVMEYPINKGGERVGHARVSIQPDGTADIGWLGPDKRGSGNLGLGQQGVRDLMRQIKRDHPEIKRFSGGRTGRSGPRRFQVIDSLNTLGQ